MFNLRLRSATRLGTGVLLMLFCVAALAADRGKETGSERFEIPTWFKDSFLEIADDAAEAAEESKHLLIFFHLEGCPYCKRMIEENFTSGETTDFLKANFNAIDINIRGDREVIFDEQTTLTEKQLARAMKVMYTPAIVFANADNKKVLRLEGYRDPQAFRTALNYVRDKAYDNTTFKQYVADERSNTPGNYSFRDHPAFESATDLKALAQNPLAIVFEETSCTGCDEVHDNLFAREDVTDALTLLKVVRLDAASQATITGPDGSATTPKALAARYDVTYRPGVLLFDKGVHRATINNRLYSWHFSGFIKWLANAKYDEHKRPYSYIAQLTEARLKSGQDVSYRDDPL